LPTVRADTLRVCLRCGWQLHVLEVAAGLQQQPQPGVSAAQSVGHAATTPRQAYWLTIVSAREGLLGSGRGGIESAFRAPHMVSFRDGASQWQRQSVAVSGAATVVTVAANTPADGSVDVKCGRGRATTSQQPRRLRKRGGTVWRGVGERSPEELVLVIRQAARTTCDDAAERPAAAWRHGGTHHPSTYECTRTRWQVAGGRLLRLAHKKTMLGRSAGAVADGVAVCCRRRATRASGTGMCCCAGGTAQAAQQQPSADCASTCTDTEWRPRS
jgi:hypothetical protein